ncbi:hypothetical protein APS_0770 [Acetobacter pasteurianus subsp. pasteurianus LMG 1262 = NBRC 106471]|nr:hypothetical protein APS_0770 [Acetobacter pasteurianus subsp. pasteurianus LMG 1262 = NBRC 106471]
MARCGGTRPVKNRVKKEKSRAPVNRAAAFCMCRILPDCKIRSDNILRYIW